MHAYMQTGRQPARQETTLHSCILTCIPFFCLTMYLHIDISPEIHMLLIAYSHFNFLPICIVPHAYVYVYIYIYIHTYKHTYIRYVHICLFACTGVLLHMHTCL